MNFWMDLSGSKGKETILVGYKGIPALWCYAVNGLRLARFEILVATDILGRLKYPHVDA